jgi:hypothetical protein
MAEHRHAPPTKSEHPVISRRDFVRGSLLGASAVCVGGLAGGAAYARGRRLRDVPKPVALYQNVPNGRERCGRCIHFRPPNGCEIVIGRISPRGWCRYYEAG